MLSNSYYCIGVLKIKSAMLIKNKLFYLNYIPMKNKVQNKFQLSPSLLSPVCPSFLTGKYYDISKSNSRGVNTLYAGNI